MIIFIKFSFYFTGEPVTGWDTVGHYHQARVYGDLFRTFDSTGVDLNWYQGMPAFYFYPPFFYFAVNMIRILSGNLLSFNFCFNISILAVILFFSFAYLKLADILLIHNKNRLRNMMPVFCGLCFYLFYQGNGLQGVSIPGVLEGTFISTLGHSLILLCFYFMEKIKIHDRKQDYIYLTLLISLIFYTHYLSAVFFMIFLAVYFLFYYRELRIKAILTCLFSSLLISSPIILLFIRYKEFSSGASMSNFYPPMIAFLGEDFIKIISSGSFSLKEFLNALIIGFKFMPVLMIMIFLYGLFKTVKYKAANDKIYFMFFTLMIFFILGNDYSFSYIFIFISVHWYRAFDLFFVFFTFFIVFILDDIAGRLEQLKLPSAISAILPLLLLINFIFWNPLKQEEINNIQFYKYNDKEDVHQLEEFFASLESGSLIYPELIQTKIYFGSPHWPDFIIQKTGHRNALGLMVESSLTPVLSSAYMLNLMKHLFIWGIDIDWIKQFSDSYNNSGDMEIAACGYLKNSGIDYILVITNTMKDFLDKYPGYFEGVYKKGRFTVYRVIRDFSGKANLLKGRPAGFIDARVFESKKLSKKEMNKDFLLYSNKVKIRTGDYDNIMINLTPFYKSSDIDFYNKNLSSLIIYNPDDGLNPGHFIKQLTAQTDIKIILVNFKKSSYAGKEFEYINTAPNSDNDFKMPDNNDVKRTPASCEANKNIITVSGNSEGSPVEIKYSYFPDWHSAEGKIFQTDMNQMVIFPDKESLSLKFKGRYSKIITVMMIILTLSIIMSVIYNLAVKFIRKK